MPTDGLDDTIRSDPPETDATASTLHGPEPAVRSVEPGLRARVASALFGGPPTTIGRFEILGELGQGGMSVVYRARDPGLDREVAIKLLRGGTALGTQGRARLQREAMAMAKLSHPNVAHVYEVGIHEGEVFIAMEYVVGETLRGWVASHRGERAAIVAMFRAAGEGLAAAHEAGFVHRDFKPDNVIVGSDGRPRVLDFGLAAVLGDDEPTGGESTGPHSANILASLTATGSILGTPAYMAPEQHRGEATDARTDQFAFCVALWEALAGQRPFAGDTLGALAAAVTSGEIEATPTSVPPAIERELRRGLAVAPGDRFGSIRELLTALDAAEHRAARGRRSPMKIVGSVVAGVIAAAVTFVIARPPESSAPDATAEPDGTPEPEPATAEPPAPKTPPSPPGPATLRQITRTSGHGLDDQSAAIDARGERAVYTAEGRRWVVDLAGGIPRPLDLGPADYGEVSFDPSGDAWLARDDAGLWRVKAGGARERLAYDVPKDAGLVMPSPTHDEVVVFEPTTARIQPLGAPARTLPFEDRNVLFASWAPGGERWAVITTAPDWSAWRLLVLDRAGAVVSDVDLGDNSEHFEGFSLTDDGHVVVSIASFARPTVRCLAVEDTGVRLLAERALDLPRSTVATVLRGTPSGGTILQVTRFPRDVGILDAIHPGPMQALSRDLDANNRLPYWIGNDAFAFVTDRFGGGTRMTHDLGSGQDVPDTRFAGDVIACATVSDAPLCIAGTPAAFFRADDPSSATRIASAPLGTATLDCTGDGRCRAMVNDETDSSIHAVDPHTGATTRLFACNPGPLACSDERLALAPDAGSMIASKADRTIVRIDADTGEILDPALVTPPPGFSAQSAAESPDGAIISTQMADGQPAAYRIVRTDHGKSEILWEDPETWAVRPRISPDGRHLLVTTVLFHAELALLPDDLCG